MAKSKFWSLAGVLVIAGAAYGLSEGGLAIVNANGAHDAYVGCLDKTYVELGGRHETLAVRAYQKCAAFEGNFVTHLTARGIADDRIRHVVVRVNEASFARYLGVGIEATRGCLQGQQIALTVS